MKKSVFVLKYRKTVYILGSPYLFWFKNTALSNFLDHFLLAILLDVHWLYYSTDYVWRPITFSL